MSSSKTASQRLVRLRAGYRTAFREWISARHLLGGSGRSADAESEAQAQEVAAALAYRNARNHLTDAISGLGDRNEAGFETGHGPLLNPKGTLSLVKDNERWEFFRDFALALALIGLAVAGGTFLADLGSFAK